MSLHSAATRRARSVARVSPSLALSLAIVALASPGCGIFSPAPTPPKIGIEPLPLNDSPKGAIDRLQRTYERQLAPDYTALLTTDFRYTFSSQSDPALVTQYGDTWGKDDETESAKHLFEGFTNTQGQVMPAATNIAVRFDNDQYFPDPAHSDSAAWYQYCPVSAVNLTIDAPQPDGSTTTYFISAPHSFYLVRGDAAVLDAGQRADSTRWYVRRWDDLSPKSTASVTAPAAPLAEASWGGVKGSYGR